MKFEQFNLFLIKKNGFSFFVFKMNREMKNVKPQYKGIRETFSRSIIGCYVTPVLGNYKYRLSLHFLFYYYEFHFNRS